MRRREKHDEPRAFAAKVTELGREIADGAEIPEKIRRTDVYRVAIGLDFLRRQLAIAASGLRPEFRDVDGFREAVAILAHVCDGSDHPIEDFMHGVERRGATRLDHVAEDYLDACFAAIEVISAVDKIEHRPACRKFSRWAKFKGERLTEKQWADLYRNRAERRDRFITEHTLTICDFAKDRNITPLSAAKIYIKLEHDRYDWRPSSVI